MKRYLLFVLALFFVACTIEYDGETRLVVESYVKDTDGNPLAGKEVSIVVSDGQNHDNISNGVTDSNGKSLLIFPSPKSDEMTVHVTVVDDLNHQGKYFTNISKQDFNNFKLVLDDIVLFRNDQITTLHIDLNQSADTMHLNGYWIEGETSEYYIDYDVDLPEPYRHYIPSTTQLLKNQDAVLHYSVTDMNTMTITEYQVPITIGNDPVTYLLTY